MRLHNTWPQRPEIGSFAMRMLWIPAIASVLVIGFLALRMPQNEITGTMAVATAEELASQGRNIAPADVTPRATEAALATPDEAIAQHQALDPVGAGHDTPR